MLPAAERLSKEKDPYVQQCMEALVQTVVGVVPSILETINTDIALLASGRRTPGPGSSPARGSPRSSLPLFPVILNLINSPAFRSRMLDEHVLEGLASFLKRLETSSFPVSSTDKSLQSRIFLSFMQLSRVEFLLKRRITNFCDRLLPYIYLGMSCLTGI